MHFVYYEDSTDWYAIGCEEKNSSQKFIWLFENHCSNHAGNVEVEEMFQFLTIQEPNEIELYKTKHSFIGKRTNILNFTSRCVYLSMALAQSIQIRTAERTDPVYTIFRFLGLFYYWHLECPNPDQIYDKPLL